MNESKLICPKCGGPMEQGYLLDASHGATMVGRWARGTPKRGWLDFWGSLCVSEPRSDGIVPVKTFRCQTCGYLESYARKEFRPQ